jgi:hypothetical protein
MSTSFSADRTLLALAEVLTAVDTAMRGGDTVPMIDEVVRGELADRWMQVAASIAQTRARTPKGRRVKAITLQQTAEKLSPAPGLFTDLALSLARDLSAPLRRDQDGAR